MIELRRFDEQRGETKQKVFRASTTRFYHDIFVTPPAKLANSELNVPNSHYVP